MNLWGVIVAGGTGSRFGRLKQLELLRGRRVVEWSVDAVRTWCTGVVVVVPQHLVTELEGPIAGAGVDAVVAGGVDRSASVRAGLDALEPSATHVLVHDAARPLATTDMVGRVVDALRRGAPGVVPVVPVSDTLRVRDGTAVDRSEYVAVQTPQGFDLATLRSAHASGLSATDDASLLDQMGLPVTHVEGDVANFKITEPHDLRIAEVLLDAR